ncbi:universal stress protein [Neptunomonas sp.]|uniref:universal stress protein n=1 Tax=Neptunomonas sp. TaxID=1971898 RepID=UPI003565A4C4
MAKYRKILVAIDLSEEAKQVLGTAVDLCQVHNAELLVVHIVEPVSTAYGGVYMTELSKTQDELNTAAKEHLTTYVNEFNIEANQQIITVGHPDAEIHRLAEMHDIDLIVIGSHGRRGLQRFILGSTANGVMQSATCDVLAVRVK